MKIFNSILITLLISGADLIAGQNKLEQKITLEDIYRDEIFSQKSIYNIRSMKDGMHYTVLENYNSIVKYAYATGKKISTLFAISEDENIPYISEYELSDDETKMIVSTNIESLYRNSYYADYYIIDLKTDSVSLVSEFDKIRNASLSPTGDKVAYIYENNIYINFLKNNTQQQITFDGKKNKIINGVPDWVYEEEFGFVQGYQWSLDGNSIAYYKFDESRVKYYSIPKYTDTYPENYTYKYPKAGEKNAIVNIYIYNLEKDTSLLVDIGKEANQYIPVIKWVEGTEELAVIRLNRLQNHVDILLADATNGHTEKIYSEKNKYYISGINDNYLTFTKKGKSFVIISEQDGYRHLYHYDISGKLLKQITSGDFDVDEMIGIDREKDIIYYSSHEESPLQTNVYRIRIDGLEKERLSVEDGTNYAEFSKDFSYYINYHSSASQPYIISLHNSKTELIRVLEDNAELKQRMVDYGFSSKDFFRFTTTEGIQLNGFMIKPASFKKNKKYPVLMYVYGGPESQLVTDAYSYHDAWFQYLAQQGYIIVCVDNRGTDGRGEDFRKSTYMQLGKLETVDQIETAIYLSSLPYVDKNRIGIFGWSYGGYMTLLCMTKGNSYFKAGIAVAPVTNWRYYDTIYTERFMRTPQENPNGYDDNSPINYADKMTGKLLLIHGTADDNVHFQNSAMMINKLIDAGKQFHLQIYPDKQHGIRGIEAQLHLYKLMSNFLIENL